MRCLFLCLPRTLETPSLPRHFVHGHTHTERRGAEIAGIFPLSRDTRKSHSFTPLEIERGKRTPLPQPTNPNQSPHHFLDFLSSRYFLVCYRQIPPRTEAGWAYHRFPPGGATARVAFASSAHNAHLTRRRDSTIFIPKLHMKFLIYLLVLKIVNFERVIFWQMLNLGQERVVEKKGSISFSVFPRYFPFRSSFFPTNSLLISLSSSPFPPSGQP